MFTREIGSCIIVTVGVLVLLNILTTLVGNSASQSVSAQTIFTSFTPGNDTLNVREGNGTTLPSQEGFSVRLLSTNFSAPHNVLYGPDNVLWITERVGKTITRVDSNNGSKLNSMPVPYIHQSGGQDGLMGMAFDLAYNNTHHIYVAYTYDADPGGPLERHTKITRFTYDPITKSIAEPLDLISGLSGSIDHNSGRMTFGTDGRLFYIIRDQGKNYLSLYCLNNQAQKLPTADEVQDQNWSAYEGKVLRMNSDGSIPDDNPQIKGVRSHIYTYGHRNAQGIAVGSGGDIYLAEHGDKSDDEVNRLRAAGNYGWPYVAGYKDDKVYQYINWSGSADCKNLTFSNTSPPPSGVPIKNESEFEAPNFVPPIRTLYTVENGYNFVDPEWGDTPYICWPTVAPSSLRRYSLDVIPGWENNFL